MFIGLENSASSSEIYSGFGESHGRLSKRYLDRIIVRGEWMVLFHPDARCPAQCIVGFVEVGDGDADGPVPVED